MVPLYKYKDWEGTAETLAETAGGLMQGEAGFGEADFAPNERLVRDYVARGVLASRSAGQEAILALSSLCSSMACRAMLADGWPLSKIAEDFRHANLEDTLALIPGEQRSNEALNLIESFRRSVFVERIMEAVHHAACLAQSAWTWRLRK